jgi:hypothetical protein
MSVLHFGVSSERGQNGAIGADKLVQKDYLAPAPMKWEWQDNFDKETHVRTYRVTYKCKHCGHEWTDLIQKK